MILIDRYHRKMRLKLINKNEGEGKDEKFDRKVF